jgi:hypothetical protein
MCIDTFVRPRGLLGFTAQRMRVLRIIISAASALWFIYDHAQAAGTMSTPEQRARVPLWKGGYLMVAASNAAMTGAARYHDESTKEGLPTTGPTDPNGPPG